MCGINIYSLSNKKVKASLIILLQCNKIKLLRLL